MTTAGPADPLATSEALATLRSAGSHPIVQCFPQGAIIVFDRDLCYLSAGGLGLLEVGLSREMLEGNTIDEVFPPDVVAVIEPLYRQALAGGESSIDVPFQGRIYQQRLGPLRAADGTIVAGMGFTQDVTADRRRERELVESELRFREFLSRASHELRTPLNAVLGYGQLLELEDLTSNQQDAVHHILGGGRHLVNLVDDILDITQTYSEYMNLEAVDTNLLLDGCVQQMAPLATEQDVQLHYQPGVAADSLVQADLRRLKQVVTNLLSNAIKFNRPDGRVDITYEVSGNSHNLDIVVRDTGIGIATHDLPRLFLPFDRIDTEAANRIVGTGLGLTVCRALMATMGGTLQASSQEGVGSIFTASIPLAPMDGDHGRSTPAVSTGPIFGAPKTLLYIEDNSMNVGLLEQILAYRPNVTLHVAKLGRVGLEMALRDPPHLILLDLHLPDISGQEVLRHLRADPRTATTPVVILSADATPDQPQRLIAMGATAYQTKPVKVSDLLDEIDRVETSAAKASAAPVSCKTNPISRPESLAVGDADQSKNDGVTTTLSTFRHEMVNLLGVILTYGDLLASDETKPSKITWLERQSSATEQAIELTQGLRAP